MVNVEAETYLEDPPEVAGHDVGPQGCEQRKVITEKVVWSLAWTSGGW